ncbi:MAG: hypothetical protein EG824_07050 [Deltaproteobacteria bacterium]|nr:hypothetical protein [Deltaproteobacteria bacterium]
MKRLSMSSAILGVLGIAALVLVAATPAKAAFVVGGENGWQMSYDGMINAFMVYTFDGNSRHATGTTGPNYADQSFRVRTGLLPSIFAFNVKSPTIDGVDYAARIGLYPQINNTATRTGFGPGTSGAGLDVREVFFTADGKFGQFLVGRALCLYQGKNILTDMTLFGVGVPGDLTGGGTTLGRIGFGYVYPTFNSQFRYTTPDMGGFKAALSINDPSQITGPTMAATKVNQPRFETELSFAKAMGNVKLQAWAAGLYQEAQVPSTHHKVASIGGAGGAGVTVGGFDFLVSGFGGQGIGLTIMQDGGDSLDIFGKERTTYGGLAQALYSFGKVKFGLQYGINYADRTEGEVVAGVTPTKSQQAATVGVYYSVNKYLQLIGEYTWARISDYDYSKFDRNSISLGTIFVW